MLHIVQAASWSSQMTNTDPLKPCWALMSQTHGATLTATQCLADVCVCSAVSLPSSGGSSQRPGLRAGGDRQDSSAVSPRRCTPSEQAVLTLCSALLTAESYQDQSKHRVDVQVASLSFFIWPFSSSVLHWIWRYVRLSFACSVLQTKHIWWHVTSCPSALPHTLGVKWI